MQVYKRSKVYAHNLCSIYERKERRALFTYIYLHICIYLYTHTHTHITKILQILQITDIVKIKKIVYNAYLRYQGRLPWKVRYFIG